MATTTMAEASTVNQQPPLIHKLSNAHPVIKSVSSLSLMWIVGLLIGGVATGFLVSQLAGGSVMLGKQEVAVGGADDIKKGQVYGSQETKDFGDSTEGELQSGGLDGEGSHKLIRPGGESQTAYLTSSTLELDKFVGRKVKVWGQTYKSQKAGWFMDVGRVEVLE